MTFSDAVQLFSTSKIQVVDVESLGKAYKSLALACHPDRTIDKSAFSMVVLNKAWGLLKKDPSMAIASISLAQSGFQQGRCPYSDDPLYGSGLPALNSRDELCRAIWSIFESDVLIDDLENSQDTYLSGSNLYACKSWVGHIELIDLENAMERGDRNCTRYLLQGPVHQLCAVENFIIELERKRGEPMSVRSLFDWCESLSFNKNSYGLYDSLEFPAFGELIRISKRDCKGLRVFSPFKLSKLKRLTEIPKKMTRNHLYRALANGQFCDYKIDMYLTDDYAMDAASNFRKSMISNPIGELTDYIEAAGPNHLWMRDGYVHLGNHNNDHRSLRLVIENSYPVMDVHSLLEAKSD